MSGSTRFLRRPAIAGARRGMPAMGRQAQMPAPVSGLNARDGITAMSPTDALILDNIIPEQTYCRLRRGFISWATGMPSPPETIMEWAGATRRMFSASGTAIYDTTVAGAVGASVVSGLANARFQHVMFSNAAGNFLVAVNGADGVRTYNGTVWAVQAITGVSAALLYQVASWKRRLWFAEKDSSRAWYLGTDAIAGAATSLDLGAVWRRGGSLARIVATSYDTTGSGMQDYIGFLSTNGEIAVYTGNDPAFSATFALVGVYLIGSPVGDRCSYQSGGDTVIITNDGALSLMEMMRVGDRTVSPRASITDKISPIISDAWTDYGSLYGWQIIGYPTAHLAILNVPTSANTADQYVLNAITGAWCRWTGHNAKCWGNFNEGIYFGSASVGTVFKADTGTFDNGAQIPFSLKTSFQDFGSPATLKRFTLLRPILQVNATPTLALGVDVDYGMVPLSSVSSPPLINVALWDSALWDVSSWAGDSSLYLKWASLGAIGRVAAVRMEGQAGGLEMIVNAFDVMMEPAGGPAL